MLMAVFKSAAKRAAAAAGRAVKIYRYYSDRRFTTVAGTLVYFLLMSLAPFLFWLSMFFGDVDLEELSSLAIFDVVLPFLKELQDSAVGATSGAGIVFMLTTLYSSTNFFYHLRRSGEIIYGGSFKKSGLKLRLASLGLIVATISLIAGVLAVLVAGRRLLGGVLNEWLLQFLVFSVALAMAAAVAALLNVFICPYKVTFGEVIPGSLFTVLLWLLCAAGFAVYMRFAEPGRLYGRVASVIVFLLWCYLMMNSFVIGVIYNGRHGVRLKHTLAPS